VTVELLKVLMTDPRLVRGTTGPSLTNASRSILAYLVFFCWIR